jgi:hypothetical protein
MLVRFLAVIAICMFSALSGVAQTKLLRFPEIHIPKEFFCGYHS